MAYAKQLKTLSLVALGALLLAGCVSGKPAPDTYTSRSGAAKTIESDRDLCIRSCNEQFERCNDRQSPMRSDVGSDPAPRLFDIASDCRESLRSCLPKCKGR